MNRNPLTDLTGFLLRNKEPGSDNLADSNRLFEIVYDELRVTAG
jgi:hypothetical protein